jgi:hypothetical protein
MNCQHLDRNAVKIWTGCHFTMNFYYEFAVKIQHNLTYYYALQNSFHCQHAINYLLVYTTIFLTATASCILHGDCILVGPFSIHVSALKNTSREKELQTMEHVAAVVPDDVLVDVGHPASRAP